MSKAKAKEMRKYILARALALPGKSCEWPGNIVCVNRADDVHHACGRAGAMLNDQRHWWFLCRQHHSWIHCNAREARKLGLLK
jgi:hypothetical protein